jgi:hypothetical protein
MAETRVFIFDLRFLPLRFFCAWGGRAISAIF